MDARDAPLWLEVPPSFPPLMHGEPVRPGTDPFEAAIAAARNADPGTVFWSPDPGTARAALVLAPETTLDRSMAMVFAAACGLNDALGALAPPEMALQHVWPDAIKANGACCGVIRAAADSLEPTGRPDWLVVSITVLLAHGDDNPGRTPEITSLLEEGCVDLTAIRLIESWSRHTLVWINRWMDDGFQPLHAAWLARADGRDAEVALDHGGTMHRGRFLGLDEFGDLLLETVDGTHKLSLLSMLDGPRDWPLRRP
jgi:biotin-(acetyl-CoA carboxylase) ligase